MAAEVVLVDVPDARVAVLVVLADAKDARVAAQPALESARELVRLLVLHVRTVVRDVKLVLDLVMVIVMVQVILADVRDVIQAAKRCVQIPVGKLVTILALKIVITGVEADAQILVLDAVGAA